MDVLLRTAGAGVAAATLVATAVAQQTVLAETFSTSQGTSFPPPGWTEDNNGVNPGWEDGAANSFPTRPDQALHDDYSPGQQSENKLVTPPLDLSGMSAAWLHFRSDLTYANYLANHPSSLGNGASYVQVSTNGGSSWTREWEETATVDGVVQLSIDLSAYAGLTGVQIGFHYSGDYAHAWGVDDVLVCDGPVGVLAEAIEPASGHEYFLTNAVDWNSTGAFARDLGGDLVTVQDAAENSWLQSEFGGTTGNTRAVWLGYNDVASEGTWVWTSGETPGYSNWAAGEPNNSTVNDPNGEDAAELQGDTGRWNDVHLGAARYGLIEASGPRITLSNVVSGQLGSFSIDGMEATSSVIFVFSTTGSGPVNTPYGSLQCSPPLIRTPAFPSGPGGSFGFDAFVPPGFSGLTLYAQAVELHAGGGGELSQAEQQPVP